MKRAPGERALVLALLLLAYIFNFLDRQMLGILAQPIKADLHLSDTEFGAIGGLAFALLYSVLGLPLAILADRTSRSARHRRLARGLERVHRACAERRRASANCSSTASASASAKPAASPRPMR